MPHHEVPCCLRDVVLPRELTAIVADAKADCENIPVSTCGCIRRRWVERRPAISNRIQVDPVHRLHPQPLRQARLGCRIRLEPCLPLSKAAARPALPHGITVVVACDLPNISTADVDYKKNSVVGQPRRDVRRVWIENVPPAVYRLI